MMILCLNSKNNQNLTSILLSYLILILILNLQNSRRKLIKKFHRINQKRNSRSSISINSNQSTKTIYNLKGFRLKIVSTNKCKGKKMLDNKFSFRIGLQVMSILSTLKDISSYSRDNTLVESIGKINKGLKVWQNNSY